MPVNKHGSHEWEVVKEGMAMKKPDLEGAKCQKP
jgi:hypothetical protein